MPSRPRLDVSAIRKLAAERVEQTSLRAVAEEIGMSKSGLESFLKGREPYSTTRPRITEWYVRAKHPHGVVSAQEIEGAIAILRVHIDSAATSAEREKRTADLSHRLYKRLP